MRIVMVCTCMVLLQAFAFGQDGIPPAADDIVVRTPRADYRLLPNPSLREADLFYEKRVWEVLDTREKINLPFRYPGKELFTLLNEAVLKEKLTAYSPEKDDFSRPMSVNEVSALLTTVDTVPILDVETMNEYYQVISNPINPETIIRYKIKEVWYFDAQYSTLRVRILGIAPLVTEYDADGNFKWERPLFWVYYPEARKVLAGQNFFNPYSKDKKTMIWEDLFEMRQFSSYIVKEGNVYDRRLQDYLAGRDLLLEADKIKQGRINFEEDLWSR